VISLVFLAFLISFSYCFLRAARSPSVAAASILAKTYRDDYMNALHQEYPFYDWNKNKGYPTKKHRAAIREHGATPYHRMTFNLLGEDPQLSFDF
jgi:ribonuclease HII